jgi:ubiquinone/menaquinone biosynthesis C-methylase UbiE
VACGTGLVAFGAAEAVGSVGSGADRMDAELLVLPDASFDVRVCAFARATGAER